MVFDDTFNHEVWNDTDETRVVLFVDVLRPLPSPWAQINRAIVKAIGYSPSCSTPSATRRRGNGATGRAGRVRGPRRRPLRARGDRTQIVVGVHRHVDHVRVLVPDLALQPVGQRARVGQRALGAEADRQHRPRAVTEVARAERGVGLDCTITSLPGRSRAIASSIALATA